jgi:2-methylcitrate dehydratase
MSPLQSGAPPPSKPQEYDPEIKDMASYIHNYKVDSELAVSTLHCVCLKIVAANSVPVRHGSLGLH